MADLFNFVALPALTQSALNRLAEEVAGVIPNEIRSWRIRTSDLDPASKAPAIIKDVASWAGKGSVFLYYLRLNGPYDLEAVSRAYSKAKDGEENQRAYARLMRPSTWFYVGTSGNLSQRLKEHLGYGVKQTYSLQLAHWASGLPLNLDFVCARYSKLKSAEVYQSLEDTLWDQVKPMFGRKGKR